MGGAQTPQEMWMFMCVSVLEGSVLRCGASLISKQLCSRPGSPSTLARLVTHGLSLSKKPQNLFLLQIFPTVTTVILTLRYIK